MSIEILQEFPLFRSMIAEAVEEGRAEGRAEGEMEGMRATILRVLEGRFNGLSQDVVEAISAANAAALNELAIHAGTDTPEQLRERLGLVKQ
jgi:flagellar biosynthesis/type III secretory pathway protein FliH